jgi:hypothetical protein
MAFSKNPFFVLTVKIKQRNIIEFHSDLTGLLRVFQKKNRPHSYIIISPFLIPCISIFGTLKKSGIQPKNEMM